MNNIILAINAVVPMFLLIGLGYYAGRKRIIDEKASRQANNLCYRFFLSAIVYNSVYRTETGNAMNVKLILFCTIGFIAGVCICAILVKFLVKDAGCRGAMLQALQRANLVLLGVPIARSLYGDAGVGCVSVLVAIMVPLYNVFAVLSIEMFNGKKVCLTQIVRSLITNPLIAGAIAGVATLLLGIHWPIAVESALSSLANAGTPMALVLMGASICNQQFGRRLKPVMACTLSRLVIWPFVFVSLGVLLGFRGVDLVAILCTFGCPVAVSSYTLALQLKADAEFTAEAILMTTVCSCLTLFLWIFGLKTLQLL